MIKAKNKILITGSNSFIGNGIVKYLSKYNYNIIELIEKIKKNLNLKK